jgi:hypothetical protein
LPHSLRRNTLEDDNKEDCNGFQLFENLSVLPPGAESTP